MLDVYCRKFKFGWEVAPWKNKVSPSVRSVKLETWCPYPILAVKEQTFIIRPGFAPILIADSILKSEMVTFILMSLS